MPILAPLPGIPTSTLSQNKHVATSVLKLLSGGTFTTGASADWRAQFASGVAAYFPSMSGEVIYPGVGTTFGIYAAYSFTVKSPFDFGVYVTEASVGSPVQVYCNGLLIAEQASAARVACSACQGVNTVEFVRGIAPLAVVPDVALFGVPGA